MEDARVRQSRWQRIYIAPSVNVGDQDDVYALKVLSEILGGGSTSRLYQALVVKQAITASVSAFYMEDAVSYGRFYLSALPSPGVSIREVEVALEAEIEKVLAEGIPTSDVARAKKRLGAQLVYAKDSPNNAARTVGALLAVGLSIQDIEAWPGRIEQVTAEQVNRAAHRLFNEAPSGTGVLLPKGGAS